MNLLTPDHPMWGWFNRTLHEVRLQGFYGCNGTHQGTIEILREHLPEIDIAAQLAWFFQRGGFCDCEIFWNCCGGYEEGHDTVVHGQGIHGLN